MSPDQLARFTAQGLTGVGFRGMTERVRHLGGPPLPFPPRLRGTNRHRELPRPLLQLATSRRTHQPWG